jgi:monofunctional glycosyltransferase
VRLRRIVRAIALWIALVLAGFAASVLLAISALKWIDPPTTAVQIQRRLEAVFARKAYTKRHKNVSLERISPDLQHAVIAAEDTRFLQHSGIDWAEIEKLAERGKLNRGASTISQQLFKNLFFTTTRSWVRKGLEFVFVPPMEIILGKNRILELYLNVIEWGPGVYGAEAAAQYWYRIPAARVGREQAARLASVIPSPLRRRPDRMDNYSNVILTRMRQMGW